MAGALSSSVASHAILRRFLRPPTACVCLLAFFPFKPHSILLETTLLRSTSLPFQSSLSSRSLVTLPSLCISSVPQAISEFSPLLEERSDEALDSREDEIESENDGLESEEDDVSEDLKTGLEVPVSSAEEKPWSSLPILTVKEKKELASYAHSLGKKLKSQQVGKSGVTDSVVASLMETLEANELMKLKIHGTFPGELYDAVKQLEEATGSVVVGQIGRTVILYRPSLTKLKAEEKKKQTRGVYMRKRSPSKPLLQNKGQADKPFGRGRRGSSRI